MASTIMLDKSWETPLAPVLASPSMQALTAFLAAETAAGKHISPPRREWFRALELTPLAAVRVVLLGQDPYHGPGQAHGLCFSVRPGVKPPPSLVNIFKELETDIGLPRPTHGNLEFWAQQGVLLLNSVLTAEMGKAASHQRLGWEGLTDEIVRLVAARPDPAVFLLWGNYAQRKADFVQSTAQGGRHLVLQSAHPSPLSAYNGFFGCRHFSRTNAFLLENGGTPIDWSLPEP